MNTATTYYTRWMLARDLPTVATFGGALSPADLLTNLRRRSCVGMVAEDQRGELNGFMIYELHPTHLRLLDFAVRPDRRRQCVGTALVRRLLYKTVSHRRDVAFLEVAEDNLAGLLFCRAASIRAYRVRDGVVSLALVPPEEEFGCMGRPVNRLAAWEGR